MTYLWLGAKGRLLEDSSAIPATLKQLNLDLRNLRNVKSLQVPSGLDGWSTRCLDWHYLDAEGGFSQYQGLENRFLPRPIGRYTDILDTIFIEDDVFGLKEEYGLGEADDHRLAILGFGNENLQFPLYLVFKTPEHLVVQYSFDPNEFASLEAWFAFQAETADARFGTA